MLWCAVALLLSPVAGGMLVDHCPLRFRFPEAAAAQDRWSGSDPHRSILLLGSSRIRSFSQSDELAGEVRQLTGDNQVQVFYATMGLADPIAVDYIATRLVSTGRSPRLAIIEINPDFLARKSLFFPIIIKRQMVAADIPRYIGGILLSGHTAVSALLGSRLMPFYRHRTILQEWAASLFTSTQTVAPTIVSPSEKSAVESPVADKTAPGSPAAPPPAPSLSALSWDKSFGQDSAQSAMLFAPRLRNYQLKGSASEAMEHTVAMLRAHGSAVLLVQMPLSAPFRALFTTDMTSQFSTFIHHLQTSYGCFFVNLQDRLPDTSFVDMHHGNMAGSREFCRILAGEVAPVWTKP